MPALLQAVARLVALKRLGVLLFVLLATLCATHTASAHERLQTKTRVRNFELAEHHSHGLSTPVKQRKPSGKSRYWCPNSHQIHSFRWRDPSGRFLDGGAAEAGEAALAALEAAGAVGEVAAGWAVLPAAIAGYAGYNIYNQLDDFYHPIISHAENNQGKPGPGEPCKTESGGGGAKGPPAAKGDVGADDDEGPASPNWGRPETLQDHFDRHGAGVGASTPEEYARMAEQFRAEANRAGYESFNDSKGVQRIYDQATNRFGAYNADGTTRTFYTPDKGYAYWIGQVLKFK